MKQVLFILLFLPLFAFSQENLAQINPLSGRGFLVKSEISSGELVDLQLEIQLQDGFYAYHDKFKLIVTEPKNIDVGELFIDPIVTFDDKISKKQKKGVKGSATIKTQLQIPKYMPQLDFILADLIYIACTEKFCLTPRVLQLKIPISLKQGQAPANEKSMADYVKEQIEGNLFYALILIFFFGFLTSLTPCVYPLIPITLAVLGTKQERSKLQSFLISLSYVIGIGLTYAILGVIAAQTGQLFGALISHPIVVISMSLIFLLMGLSLLGLFELQAPVFIRNRLANTQTQKGFVGAFVSGLLAGVIASPCVGPVLVGVLAYIAQTQNSLLGFVLLFTFAMGFGLLFLGLGTFSQFTHKLPRSGAWMNTVKFLLAFCLFAMAAYYSWPLVKSYLPQKEEQVSAYKVSWEKFSPEKVIEAKNAGKPVIIDFYADWCGACVEMDKFTFTVKEVVDKSKNFVMLKIDATSPFDELTDWQSTYKVYGLPTMIFIDKNGNVLEDLTLTGFEEASLFTERMDKTLQRN